ncbi:hypothetical protein SAY87_004255 [Trapa incisa]|uniref:SAM domain-containing protein n=1 Tax=Trapa incisa TaxID=236973 RepID=A0AAN7JRH3_9MYRT|nr:hypothetical protein SAY87_004255 [Trapa incisa]
MSDSSMNQKRQRRPNVRLGEVGDAPAAFACWFSQETREFLTQGSWENGSFAIQELDDEPSGDNSTSPIASTEKLQVLEKEEDPNSSKSIFHYNFGGITWKTRKPRGRNAAGTGAFTGTCGSMLQSPGSCSRGGAVFSGRESSGGFGSNARLHHCYPNSESMEISHPHDRDMKSVCRWLEERGFGEYANVFTLHEVDEEALPLLTPADLKEMGVFAVGHRRKLYTAIQKLRCCH